MAPKLPQNHGNAKCFCGTRQSRNHASLFPCASGTPGESGWPGRTNGGSTANLSNGANQDSFFPGPTALPWAEQPCTTLCGDSTWQKSAAASSPSLRKRSESLSSVGILLSEGSGSRARLPPRVPRRSDFAFKPPGSQLACSLKERIQFRYRPHFFLRIEPLFELFERGNVGERPQTQSKQSLRRRPPKIQLPGRVAVDQAKAQEIVQV